MVRSVLAVGNTASVMSTIANYLPSLTVCEIPVDRPEVQQIARRRVEGPRAPVSSISWFRFMRKAAASNWAVHSELQFAPSCLQARIGYGIHVHGTTDALLLYPQTRIGKVLKSTFREALYGANYVLCHRMLWQLVRRLRGDAKVFESPVDLNQFSPGGASLRFSNNISLFSPSRIDQWKGHEIIWEALERMRNRAKVTLFQSDWGWEPFYSKLRKISPSNVRYVHVIPRAHIAEYYRGAHIVVGQMKLGHLGLSELEAAACGVPVTVFNSDGNLPFLPKRSDPLELAELLDRLIEDEAFRAGYSSKCRDHVVRHHDAARLAEQFAETVERSDLHPPQTGARLGTIANLEAGTGVELFGRILGEKSKPFLGRLLSL